MGCPRRKPKTTRCFVHNRGEVKDTIHHTRYTWWHKVVYDVHRSEEAQGHT